MKRFLSMLMTLVLLCGCFAMAEVKTFDYKVLEGLDGYSYDKFEKMCVRYDWCNDKSKDTVLFHRTK